MYLKFMQYVGNLELLGKHKNMINYYVNEIQACLKNKCYFAALSLTLMLPDICGMAKYPDKMVAERYITWYDTYLGEYLSQDRSFSEEQYLSGEVVYNLRNTFFHQGAPNVNAAKVKKSTNQIDRFALILGDGTKINQMDITVSVGNIWFRGTLIDVTFLCDTICNAALWYFKNNREKFSESINVIPQDWLFGKKSPLDEISKEGDPIGDILNEKLRESGQSIRLNEGVTESLFGSLAGQRLERARKIEDGQKEPAHHDIRNTLGLSAGTKKLPVSSKKEQEVRSFFEQNFREKQYQSAKEKIIEAVLTGATKQQVSMKLQQSFPNSEVKIIYRRLKPLIKDLPGQ